MGARLNGKVKLQRAGCLVVAALERNLCRRGCLMRIKHSGKESKKTSNLGCFRGADVKTSERLDKGGGKSSWLSLFQKAAGGEEAE